MAADLTPRPCDRTGVISAEMDPDYDPPSTSLNPPRSADDLTEQIADVARREMSDPEEMGSVVAGVVAIVGPELEGMEGVVTDLGVVRLELQAEVERLRTELSEAADALRAVGKAAITVKPTLLKPYDDAPETSPWTQFMEEPARRAYNLGHRIRRELKATGETETNHA